MNIDSLKCFILVAENLSFARAAEAMYKTQPAVTKQINSLEEELGASLFVRSTRHVELTPAGMAFYRDAKDIVMSAQMAMERVKRQSDGQDTISIGLSSPTVLFHLIPVLSQLHAAYPEIRPNIQVLSYKTILNLFDSKKLDVLFYFKENMVSKVGVDFKEIQKHSLVCLVPAGHAFAGKEALSLQELRDETVIVCNPLNAPLSTASFQQKVLEKHASGKVLYCDSAEIAQCMVASGLGVTILPDSLCMKSPMFTPVQLAEKTQLTLGVFYHKNSKKQVLKKFLKQI